LFATLSQKLKLGKVILDDMIDLSNAKTKDAEKMLKNFESIAGFETSTLTRKTISCL
jgi:hypothetical protein